jgi:F-type H+-transporting ATPase subunit a
MADPNEIISHVQDATSFHIVRGWVIDIPQPFGEAFPITKFMVVELVAAILVVAVFVPLAMQLRDGNAPRGRLANFFEAMLIFIRDEVARPSIGEHHADRFLPFLWTLFFFVLFGNLLGMIPWIGAPNGSLSCTSAIAATTFLVVIGAGMKTFGVAGYWKGQVPQMDVPLVMGIFLKPMLFVIEVAGLLVKHVILAMRLFANIFAGHLVLVVILGFIVQLAGTWAWYGITPVTVIGSVALNLLELLVCFIQAYVFTFLAAIFIGMAVHQH